MRRYQWVMVVGLFWAGPNWAGEAFCVTHGKMVRALADAWVHGHTVCNFKVKVYGRLSSAAVWF